MKNYFLTMNALAEKQTFSRLALALFFVILCLASPLLVTKYGHHPFALIVPIALGVSNGFHMTRWILSLPSIQRSWTLVLWTTLIIAGVIHSILWTTQGEGYNAHGALGNGVDVLYTLMLAQLWFVSQKTSKPA